MATEKWSTLTSRGAVLSSELNALASAGRSAAGAEVDNSVNLDAYGQLELVLSFSTTPTLGGYVQIYAITAPGGTTYEDGSTTVDPGSHKLVDQIPVKNVSGIQRLTSSLFSLLPSKTKFLLYNGSGQALQASGSSVTLYTTNRTVS